VVASGLNHYSFFEGVDELRRAVAEKLRLFNGIDVDSDRRPLELIITSGATEGRHRRSHILLSAGSRSSPTIHITNAPDRRREPTWQAGW
jgi:aspartate/methionine/tyrosine aminotransferase